jgi:hypothetical protein
MIVKVKEFAGLGNSQDLQTGCQGWQPLPARMLRAFGRQRESG